MQTSCCVAFLLLSGACFVSEAEEPKALFIAEYVSVRRPDGIAGFEPGRQVWLVSTDVKTGKMLVTDGRFQVEVPPTGLTSDIQLAAQLRRQEQTAQRAMQTAHASTQDADALAHRRYEAALRRIELERDLNLAGLSKREAGLGAVPLGLDPNAPAKSLYDRPYGLRGDPYTPVHQDIPRWLGPHSKPGSLTALSYGLGYY